MQRIYLDLCALKRPFDDQTQPRIWLETQALSVIFQSVESRQIEVIGSSVLTYENSLNNWELRRETVIYWLLWVVDTQTVSGSIENRAETIQQMGIKPIDSLHLSCAEAGKAECFVTCDDEIRKRYSGQMKVCLPTEYVMDYLQERNQ